MNRVISFHAPRSPSIANELARIRFRKTCWILSKRTRKSNNAVVETEEVVDQSLIRDRRHHERDHVRLTVNDDKLQT